MYLSENGLGNTPERAERMPVRPAVLRGLPGPSGSRNGKRPLPRRSMVRSTRSNAAHRPPATPRDRLPAGKSYLLARYDTFACADGSHTVRGQEPARQTVCTVFTTLLFMLAAASGQISSNPYRKLCIGIARDLDGNPLYKSLYARIRASEKEEEQEGRYVDVQDYATHDAPAGTQKETHTLEVDELVETVCGMHSAACYEQVIQVLSRYNDSHGHRFQQSVDKLRNRLDTLRRAASEPRMTEQVVVQKGGMNISRSHFEGTRFDIAKKSEEPAHQLLH